MKEIWKDIPNYEGIYQASNLGRIRTCEGKTTYTKKHGVRHWSQRILKAKICHATRSKNRWDARVELWKNGAHKTYLVARLVAATFLEDYLSNPNMTVNHIDNNPLNNNIENLEWCTRKENIQKGFLTGVYRSCKKILVINKKDNSKQIYFSLSAAGRAIKKSSNYFQTCIHRKCFENNEYKWELI